MKKFIFALLLGCLFCSVFNTHGVLAADNGNGVDVVNVDRVHAFGLTADWYTSFDPSSTSYVYNESGGTVTASGQLDVSNIIDKRTLYVEVPALNSTSITVRAEGKATDSSLWAEIYTETFATVTAYAQPWPVLEYTGDIRVGLIVVGDVAGDVVNVSGEFMTQKK